MTIEQFDEIVRVFSERASCDLDGLRWSVTIRGGETFVGRYVGPSSGDGVTGCIILETARHKLSGAAAHALKIGGYVEQRDGSLTHPDGREPPSGIFGGLPASSLRGNNALACILIEEIVAIEQMDQP